MEQIIVDTSIWIDYFRGRVSPATDLVIHYLYNEGPLFVTPTTLQEALQGINDNKEYLAVKARLTALPLLILDHRDAAIGAADLYRSLRKKGVTIRKPNDCLIACYALFYDVSVLHSDADFDLIALHTFLRVRKQ